METSQVEGNSACKGTFGKLQIALFVESIGNMRRENREVDKRFDQEVSCNIGKVIYSEKNYRFTDFKWEHMV